MAYRPPDAGRRVQAKAQPDTVSAGITAVPHRELASSGAQVVKMLPASTQTKPKVRSLTLPASMASAVFVIVLSVCWIWSFRCACRSRHSDLASFRLSRSPSIR
jgi:hypothetical protein